MPLKKSTKKKYRPVAVLSDDDIESYRDDKTGFCLACGVHHAASPDAKGVACQWCKSNRVFGIDSLIDMGRIDVADF